MSRRTASCISKLSQLRTTCEAVHNSASRVRETCEIAKKQEVTDVNRNGQTDPLQASALNSYRHHEGIGGRSGRLTRTPSLVACERQPLEMIKRREPGALQPRRGRLCRTVRRRYHPPRFR